jgi:hypothetical protein
MNVGQAIANVSEWVAAQGPQMPGFRGAHLMGSILAMPHDAPLPAYRDIDFNIVCEGVPESTTHDVAYNGLILEYSVVDIERYRAPEAVLANPELASNLAAQSILVDPFGLLAPLHQAVAAQYARRRWVQARCDFEKQVVSQALQGLRQASSPLEALWPLFSAALYLSGLLAEASLRPPTHRRSMALMRDVLRDKGREDLHEVMLRLLGVAHMDRRQVEAYLDDCAAAFDCATAVTCTPVMFQFKFQPHIRPYIVEGAREMIIQGYHREAMFWISGFLMFANAAIQADAPATWRPIYQERVDRLVADLGLRTSADVAARAAAAGDLAVAIFGVADELVEGVAA